LTHFTFVICTSENKRILNMFRDLHASDKLTITDESSNLELEREGERERERETEREKGRARHR
jgi:hypothetical protein